MLTGVSACVAHTFLFVCCEIGNMYFSDIAMRTVKQWMWRATAILEGGGGTGVDIHRPALHKRVQGGQLVFPAIVCVGDRSSCKTLPLYSHMFQPPHTHTHTCTQTLA